MSSSDPKSRVHELARLVGWTGSPLFVPDWSVTERRLGNPLPEDFKTLFQVFPVGKFAETALVQPPRAAGHEGDVLHMFQQLMNELRKGKDNSYAIFPDRPGLVPWAMCYNGEAGGLFWLADDGDPDDWPVVLSGSGEQRWEQYNVGAVEFLIALVKGEVPSWILRPITGPPKFEPREYLFDSKLRHEPGGGQHT